MGLDDLWFVIVAIFWSGFFVLEGFDFGVGMLHTVVGKTETERRVAINTIGPFWDGNEVWLIVAGAAMFAAFPSWYATMFSGLYLALVLVLVALMGRGVAFEYRGKGLSTRWRDTWTWVLTIGSAVVPLLIGVGLGDLLHGLPINRSGNYTGNFFDLLTPYGLWVGVTMLALCLLHGATFLSLKTTDTVRERSHGLALTLVWPVGLIVAVFAVWTIIASGHSVGAAILQVVAVLAVVSTYWFMRANQDGRAFFANAIAMAAVPASLFVDLHPNVMVSSTKAAYNLTVANSSSSHYALQVMTVVAIIFLPLVLLYQGWNYYVFRRRVTAPRSGPPAEITTEPVHAPSQAAQPIEGS
jgi:cytochrome d ubiquinol oxidase subunit II